MAFAWSCPLRSVRLTAVVEYDGKQLDLLWLSTYYIGFGSRKWEVRPGSWYWVLASILVMECLAYLLRRWNATARPCDAWSDPMI